MVAVSGQYVGRERGRQTLEARQRHVRRIIRGTLDEADASAHVRCTLAFGPSIEREDVEHAHGATAFVRVSFAVDEQLRMQPPVPLENLIEIAECHLEAEDSYALRTVVVRAESIEVRGRKVRRRAAWLLSLGVDLTIGALFDGLLARDDEADPLGINSREENGARLEAVMRAGDAPPKGVQHLFDEVLPVPLELVRVCGRP
jgi:hypothetical protein